MRFKSIIGLLDIEVISIDRIERLATHNKPRAIYINRKFGFVIGWNTDNWFLWELPREGEEVFEETQGSGESETGDKRISKPENLWIPISISSRYQWDGAMPSINLFVHQPKKEMKLEDYIRENLQVLIGSKNLKFVEEGTGMAPQGDIGFSTIYADVDGRRIYQLQKFIKKGRRIFTLSASNIIDGLPPQVKAEMAEIFNSFAFIGSGLSPAKSTVSRLKGLISYFTKK